MGEDKVDAEAPTVLLAKVQAEVGRIRCLQAFREAAQGQLLETARHIAEGEEGRDVQGGEYVEEDLIRRRVNGRGGPYHDEAFNGG